MIFGDRVTPRYVLRDLLSREAVERYAEDRGWDLVAGQDADPESGTEYERVWLTDTTLTLHYVEDRIARYSYVFLAGDDREAVERIVPDLMRVLEPWTPAELLDGVREAKPGPDRGRAVLRAGIGAPLDFDQEFFDCVRSALAHPEPPMREIGILAGSYAAWPQYRPLLEAIARDDPDAEVREMAQATLRAFDRGGVTGR